MPLPTCECNKGLPIQQQLGNIYCALAEIVAGGAGGIPIADLPVAATMFPDDVGVGNISDVTSQIPKNVATTFRADLTDNETWDGIAIGSLTADVALAFGETVVLNATSEWAKADANGAGLFPSAGLCVQAAAGGSGTTVLIQGTVRMNAHGFTIGAPLYLSGTPGDLTNTPPVASGDCVQKVGYALTADVLFLNFNGEYVTLT